MQKIILDTNVIVSALIQKSYPYFILYDLYIERKIELCVSEDLMAEYYEVLKRDKFSKFPDFISNAAWVLKDIYSNANLFHPQQKVNVIKDSSDNKFLELAVESKADYLITGNTNDFTMTHFEETKIVSPRNYWEFYK